MSGNERTIFADDVDICGEMKNSQTTPYIFIRNAYNAVKSGEFLTAKLWIEHAEKFKGFFKDNPREAENFQSVVCMTLDFIWMVQKKAEVKK